MSKIAIRAFALAGAFTLAGCATAVWQPPQHHPANPNAASGSMTGITALERYRSGMPSVDAQQSPAEPAGDASPDHHDHGEARQ